MGKRKCICAKDESGHLSSSSHRDGSLSKWHADTGTGGTEQKEGNVKKYITFAGAMSTKPPGLHGDAGGRGQQPHVSVRERN